MRRLAPLSRAAAAISPATAGCGNERRVRSAHLYAHGSELVVGAHAPHGELAEADRSGFVPLLRSPRLTWTLAGGS